MGNKHHLQRFRDTVSFPTSTTSTTPVYRSKLRDKVSDDLLLLRLHPPCQNQCDNNKAGDHFFFLSLLTAAVWPRRCDICMCEERFA